MRNWATSAVEVQARNVSVKMSKSMVKELYLVVVIALFVLLLLVGLGFYLQSSGWESAVQKCEKMGGTYLKFDYRNKQCVIPNEM